MTTLLGLGGDHYEGGFMIVCFSLLQNNYCRTHLISIFSQQDICRNNKIAGAIMQDMSYVDLKV